ncbi:glycerophosphotransferase [Periweissella cryptocerci]|uniref:Glycerophosphotransferase n=1 Tax=Periweissella cryptocerci TaxID=2506420 RepID=A0A4P6YWB7_9LACO|nr:CDP-glycerol glycerophosphotransferase family protein [Periweissella cryptocerci]QBO37081.1 glycerophosphotransferase [Periweissella cryptocerci]
MIKKSFNQVGKLLSIIPNILPIRKNKIVFDNFSGRGFGDSPKYIAQKLLLERNLDLVWLMNDINSKPNIKGIRFIKRKSIRAVYELATANVWVDNVRKSLVTRKKRKQLYIQTWHAFMGLKYLEADSENTLSLGYVKSAQKDAMRTDIMLSGVHFRTELYKRAFWFNGEVLETGTPRLDLFFENHSEINDNVNTFFKINEKAKVVLYAPTFRKNWTVEMYSLDFERVLQNVQQRFNGSWELLIRLHPNVNFSDVGFNNEKIHQASGYADSQELVYRADIIISDYSSIMFDGMIAKKKVILYVPDLDEYQNGDRKLYFKIDELPFVVAKSENELNDVILGFDDSEYESKIAKFTDEIGVVEDGHASERVAKIILEHIEGKDKK